MKINITPTIAIDDDDIQVRFIRASGPGGQHVNKVSTGVQLRYDLRGTPDLPPAVRARAMALAGQRLTNDGEIVIEATRHRSQEKNRSDAIDRLVALLKQASVPPKPRKKTRPSLAAKRRRLTDKRQRSSVKQLRRSPPSD